MFIANNFGNIFNFIQYQFMITAVSGIYLGERDENRNFAYFRSENFFSLLQVDSSFAKDEAKVFLQSLDQTFKMEAVSSLYQLEDIINQKIKENNFPLDIDLSLVFLKNDVVYLKTLGKGAIVAKKKQNIGKIIDGNNCASGKVEDGDYLILSFDNFLNKINEGSLNKLIDKKEPLKIIEDLAIYFKDGDDTGLISIIIKFGNEKAESKRRPVIPGLIFPSKIIKNLTDFYFRLEKRKRVIFIGALIFFLLFIFNTSKILIKRATDEKIRKITLLKKELIEKLNQAEDTAFFNLKAATDLIDQSKNQVNNISKDLGNQYSLQINELYKLISEREAAILKKEEKQFEEFYDLMIEKKDAVGEKFYLNNAELVILDRKNGRIHQLNLEKKSIDTYEDKKIKEAQFVAASSNGIFYLVENDGIYKIVEGRAKKVIEANGDWGEIVDFWNYSGNLYLLDKKNDEIYKYLVAGDGYSKKNSYFQSGSAVDLADANSMAIDGSIYIGFSNDIIKYTAGIRDSFKAIFPQAVKVNKIFTMKDSEKIFVWDKNKGSIFVLGKDGNYEREVRSSILNKTRDIVVFEQKIFALYDNKIYTIDL
jgi:plasmid maintenance system killer protein